MLLEVETAAAAYDGGLVLDGISFSLAAGRSLALLGRNGMGKTTLLKTLLGLTRQTVGTIRFDGQDITRWPPERRAWAGIGWVPQERAIFRSLTVLENLTAVARPGPWSPARVFELFPRLAERRDQGGGALSGGEQQMLALGRALVINPRLLLLDEPMEGLAPAVVAEVMAAFRQIFAGERMAGIIVDQHAQRCLRLTGQALVLERGRTVYHGLSADLLAAPDSLERVLGIGQIVS